VKLDWTRGEITGAEANQILAQAVECLEYVVKMLPNSERPHYQWGSFVELSLRSVENLREWLLVRDRRTQQ
jgi:hypothetical protein